MAPSNVTTARLQLAGGQAIPQVGLGVWQAARGEVTRSAVTSALAQGYRHIDTARVYGNEADVGWAVQQAIREGGLARNDIFVTTKLWNDDHGYDATLRAFEASLQRLKLDYVDLYLLHWPVHGKRLDSWEALEELQRQGRARAIGVSNFLKPHLVELLDHCERPPSVNQIELSPFLQRRETVAFCKQQGIVLEAYSPLTHGQRLDHPALAALAKQVGRSPAQILLRWGLQHGFVILPKSTSPARIGENARLFDFELTPQQMEALDGLEEGLVTGWDPASQA